jgi:aspartate kinase
VPIAHDRSLSVVKIGGSVLTGPPAFRRAASFVAQLLADGPNRQLVVVVSAEHGMTDALLSSAQDFVPDPDPETLDLLWSTGEIRSVALLVLALQALGVRAAGLNVHQTGLIEPARAGGAGRVELRPLRLRAALAAADAVVVPGFLARRGGDGIASLGRGGSDLTAVLLAAGLGANTCELVKDVPGYFSADPHVHPDAERLDHITFDRALDMARYGCDLVQPAALEAAQAANLTLHVRAIEHGAGTLVREPGSDLVSCKNR